MAGPRDRNSKESHGSEIKSHFMTFDKFDSTSSAVNGNTKRFLYVGGFS
jgi:hypothetical protein